MDFSWRYVRNSLLVSHSDRVLKRNMSVYVNLLVVDHQEIPACHVSLQECILAKDQCKIDEDQNKSSVYNLISWSFKERLQTKTTRVWKACQLCMFRFWG